MANVMVTSTWWPTESAKEAPPDTSEDHTETNPRDPLSQQLCYGENGYTPESQAQGQRYVWEMIDSVEEFLSTPVPAELWHYTSLDAFEQILASGEMWATDVRFTNDSTEFVHARDIAIAVLKKVAPTHIHTARFKDESPKIVNDAFDEGSLSPQRTEVFVTCFSSAKDLKSQWFQYADQAKGVSMAFDLTEVRSARQSGSGATLAPCVYTDDHKRELLKGALSHFEKAVERVHRYSESPDWLEKRSRDWEIVDRIYGLSSDQIAFEAECANKIGRELTSAVCLTTFDMLRAASHCKHEGFHEELEWRLALPHTKGEPLSTDIKYRGSQNQIRYVALKLGRTLLPISEVMAGPCCENLERIRSALEARGYQVPVTKSSIPFKSSNF